MSSGAIVVIRYRISNFMEHDEPDWDVIAREMIEEEGVHSFSDDNGEIVSIEKAPDTGAQEGM